MTAKVFNRLPFPGGALPWPGFLLLGLTVVLGVFLAWAPLSTAALVVIGGGAALLIFIQPLFGLALALLAGPFGALEQIVFGFGSLDSGQLLLLLTLTIWIARGLARRKINLHRTFLSLPFILLISVGLLSLIDARSVELGLRELLKWVEMLLIVLLVVDLGSEGISSENGPIQLSIIGGPPRTSWIVVMVILAGMSQAFIGIWQFALRGDGPEHFLVLDRFYRAYGTFEQPNPFGGFMNLSALLGIGILVGMLGNWWGARRERRQLRYEKVSSTPGRGQPLRTEQQLLVEPLFFIFMLLATGVTSLALLLSWSRGAWLGFAAGLGAMILFFPRRRIYGILLVGVGLLVFGAALRGGRLPAALSSRITGFVEDFRLGDVRGVDINDDNYAVLERQAHWQVGLDMLTNNILLGVGFGNYAVAYPDFALINWPDPLGHAHNFYINMLAEGGVLGFTAYLIFWSAVIWQTIRLLRQLNWPGRGLVLGLMGVWIAISVHHLVDKLYVNNIYIHLGVLFGLLQLMDLEQTRKARGSKNRRGLVKGKGT